MSKQVIIAIGTVVVVAGASGLYLLSNTGQSSVQESTQSSVQEPDKGQESAKDGEAEFNPIATKNQSLVSTMRIVGSNDSVITAVTEADGHGNFKITATTEGKTTESYVVGGKFTVCTDGKCFTATTPMQVPDSPSTYSEEDVIAWRETAVNKGPAPCPAGTCNVWEIKKADSKAYIYIADDQRVSKMEGVIPAGKYEITLDYKPVSITAPSTD